MQSFFCDKDFVTKDFVLSLKGRFCDEKELFWDKNKIILIFVT